MGITQKERDSFALLVASEGHLTRAVVPEALGERVAEPGIGGCRDSTSACTFFRLPAMVFGW